jgi:hypothetical protein
VQVFQPLGLSFILACIYYDAFAHISFCISISRILLTDLSNLISAKWIGSVLFTPHFIPHLSSTAVRTSFICTPYYQTIVKFKCILYIVVCQLWEPIWYLFSAEFGCPLDSSDQTVKLAKYLFHHTEFCCTIWIVLVYN